MTAIQRNLGRQLYSSSMITTALTGYDSASGRKTATPSNRVVILGNHRGFELFPFGVGNANTTYDMDIYGVDLAASDESQTPTDFEVVYWGSIACTLGAMTGGGAATLVTTSQKYADTVVFTTGASATFEPAYGLGTSTAYSPADDTMGRLIIPNFPFPAFLLDVILGTATSANALYALRA